MTPAPERSESVTAAMYLPSGLNERRVGARSTRPGNVATTSNVDMSTTWSSNARPLEKPPVYEDITA